MFLVQIGREFSWCRIVTLAVVLIFTTAPSQVRAQCVGDCNGDGEVTIDELVKGVDIALGAAPLSDCSALDTDASGDVTIDELIRAVSNALDGCPIAPTATLTLPSQPTASPTQPATVTAVPSLIPTATPEPTEIPTASASPTAEVTSTASFSPTVAATPTQKPSATTRTANLIPTTINVVRIFPDLLASLLGHLPSGSGSGGASLQFPFDCSAGGGGTLSCDQQLLPPGPPMYSTSFDQCMIVTSGGAIVTIDGSLSATGQDGELCGMIPTMATLGIDNLSLRIDTDNGTTQASFSGISADATLACNGGDCSCIYDTLGLQFSGTINVMSSDDEGNPVSSTTATFAPGTALTTSVQTYDFECVPLVYREELDGSVAFTTDNASYSVAFDTYVLQVDASSGPDAIDVSGALTSACLGEAVGIHTQTLLQMDRGSVCPSDGLVTVDHGISTDAIQYLDPGVNIDQGNDGSVDQTFPSCSDPQLAVCAS